MTSIMRGSGGLRNTGFCAIYTTATASEESVARTSPNKKALMRCMIALRSTGLAPVRFLQIEKKKKKTTEPAHKETKQACLGDRTGLEAESARDPARHL